ncbi:hypothetical protein ACTNCI_06040 [Mitsuokella jalaludinii]|uniref:hypothetical protein n=1 Tax=Mitsuokella jalaludinii TaxID=187979 RepID=UPI003F889EEB
MRNRDRESYIRESDWGPKYMDVPSNINHSFGTENLDYVLSHYAPETMKQLDSIDDAVTRIAQQLRYADEYRMLSQRYDKLWDKYNALNRQFKQYMADHPDDKTDDIPRGR